MIYFIQAGADGPIKIGYTRGAAKSRAMELQTGNALLLTVLAEKPGELNDEAELHGRFASLNIRGEWFRPDPALLRVITAPALVEPDGYLFDKRGRWRRPVQRERGKSFKSR